MDYAYTGAINIITKSYVKKYDVVIFSRFLKKSRRYFDSGKLDKEANENQSILFNNVCKKLFYNDITDYTSGYIYIKKEKIKLIQ